MPLGCNTATTTATTATMEVLSSRSDVLVASTQESTVNNIKDETLNPSYHNIDYEFDESQCLFCNQTNPDLEKNLVHMSKAHGLHVDRANLLLDVESLLAYFNLVITEYHECLYCGTQRNTRQAAQQHMMAKGHCKYDITDKESEFRDFYEVSSSDSKEKLHRNLPSMRLSDNPQLLSKARSRRRRPSKRLDRSDANITSSPLDQAQSTPTTHSNTDTASTSNTAGTSAHSRGELSIRALKQENMLHNQLSKLRASDRSSLAHLPTSQQMAMLATQHKQMEKATRTEQINRSNLESAGNSFNCLGKIRLIRKPPHTGNIHSLKR